MSRIKTATKSTGSFLGALLDSAASAMEARNERLLNDVADMHDRLTATINEFTEWPSQRRADDVRHAVRRHNEALEAMLAARGYKEV